MELPVTIDIPVMISWNSGLSINNKVRTGSDNSLPYSPMFAHEFFSNSAPKIEIEAITQTDDTTNCNALKCASRNKITDVIAITKAN